MILSLPNLFFSLRLCGSSPKLCFPEGKALLSSFLNRLHDILLARILFYAVINEKKN